jgi:hypothetical protein
MVQCSEGLDHVDFDVFVVLVDGSFSIRRRVQTSSEAHPDSYQMGTEVSFLGVKRPGRGFDHSPPSSSTLGIRGAVTQLRHTSPLRVT